MISTDLLDDTMSLTSLREDGLFTGEEITLKFRPGERRSSTVLVEADEILDDEKGSFVASVASAIESQSSLTRINSLSSQLEDNLERMRETRDHLQILSTDISINTMAEEEIDDEGVNTILIEEHGAPITTTEYHVGHIIPPSQPQLPPLSHESKAKRTRFFFKRNLKVTLNRAAIKVKSVLSNGKAGGTSSTETTTDTNHSDDDESNHALPTPRAAETIEEAASQHFEEAEQSSTLAASPINDGISDETRIEHTKSVDFDTITKEHYEKISSTIVNETNDTSTEYTTHVQQQLEPKSSAESDQIDQNYQGPYDDNKSFVTYSTGDFDMSQMYSRSWSLAPTVVSKTSKTFAPRRFGKSKSEISDMSITDQQQDRVVIISSSLSSKKDQCAEDNIMVVQVAGERAQNKNENCFGLDGLSLVNSLVGDDRSYVEDY
ncbi:hypothetical protein ACHAXN_000826 [Cyclotella atomus]|jgi:hypothetical protein